MTETQSNEIVPFPDNGSKFLALNPSSEVYQGMCAMMEGGERLSESDLIHVKTPSGGGKHWTVEDVDGPKVLEELVGVVCYYGLGAVVWPSFDPAPGTIPALRTDDLIKAYRMGDDLGDIDPDELAKYELPGQPGQYDWPRLSETLFGWGTGRKGIGKRAVEYRTICLLPENTGMPWLIRAKPGSLKTVKPFFKRLQASGRLLWRSVVGLKLQEQKSRSGQVYSQIVPRLADYLSPDEGRIVKQNYFDPIGELVKTMGLRAEADEADEWGELEG